jgi:hypothetical protein
MDTTTEHAFRGELHEQALVAERALKRIGTAFALQAVPAAKRAPPISDINLSNIVHDAVCQFLDSVAVVSKILSPWVRDPNSIEGKASVARGKELVAVLGLTGSEHYMPRDVRNSIEHVDERLEEWLRAENRPFIEQWAIIWPGESGDWKPLDALRTLDGRTWDFSILGDRCNLRDIYNALCELDKKLGVATSDLSLSVTTPGQAPSAVSVRMVTGRSLSVDGEANQRPPGSRQA